MPEAANWLEKLYIKDFLEFLRDSFSRHFPRINAKLSTSSPILAQDASSVMDSILPHDAGGGGKGWNAFLKGLFAWMGTSVFVLSCPLLCAYFWRDFKASRLFTMKEDELADCGVVITGCDSGIGLSTADLLSERYPSMLIFAGCYTTGGVQKLSAVRRQNLIPVRMDVTSDQDIRVFVNGVISRLGHRKLYAVINNAGVFDGSLVEVTPIEIYKRVMEVNFFGVVRVTKAFLPFLARGEAENGGRIVNISSLAAMVSSPGHTVYAATKYALTAFSDGLRQELRELGIKVIQVVPGPVQTGALVQIAASTTSLLSAGPQDVFERCGGQAFVAAQSQFFNDLYSAATTPTKIAKIIESALIRRFPKDVYYEAGAIYNLLGICPHYVRDFLLDPRTFRKQLLAKYSTN